MICTNSYNGCKMEISTFEHSADFRVERCSSGWRELRQVLRACREERRPYLVLTPAMAARPLRTALVPVSMLEEETYKAEICSYLARTAGVRIILWQAKDYGHKAKHNVDRIVTRLRKVSESTGVPMEWEVRMGEKDSFHLMVEVARRADELGADMLILTASREYGLDDILFGPQELGAIRHSPVPVMLINPRADLFSLCD